MKVGDLIKRKAEEWDKWCIEQNDINGYGIILKRDIKCMGSRSYTTPILTVYYAKSGRVLTISEKLVEVLSESR